MSLLLLRKGLRLPNMAACPARSLVSKPARDPVGPMEAAIGLTTFLVAFLVPSGWVLVNLENYKKRQ